MNASVAVITGFHKSPDFLKTLFNYLDRQEYKDFNVYVYNSSGIECDRIGEGEYSFRYKVINLEDNLGFAGGNNRAILTAKEEGDYKYYALINDDTKPQPAWLKELVKTAETDPTIGAVSPKMVFYERFIALRGKTQVGKVDKRLLGIRWYENTGFEDSYYSKRFFKEGFHEGEEDEVNLFRWTRSEFLLELPLGTESGDGDYTLRLFLRMHPLLEEQQVELSIGDSFVTTIALRRDSIFYELKIPAGVVRENAHYLIQNAGSDYDKRYNGFDIGSGEIDKGQYDQEREIRMFCGGGCLISRAALEKAGLFNSYFFSYYEDSDLSLRIRKKGYKLYYNPASLVLHYHSGTSKEWSYFFIYHVFRNKIIFAAMNFGLVPFIISFLERGKETYVYLKWNVRSRFRDPGLKSRLKLNVRILLGSIKGIIKYKPERF
jgi:GT2 family glycosyltransferase